MKLIKLIFLFNIFNISNGIKLVKKDSNWNRNNYNYNYNYNYYNNNNNNNNDNNSNNINWSNINYNQYNSYSDITTTTNSINYDTPTWSSLNNINTSYQPTNTNQYSSNNSDNLSKPTSSKYGSSNGCQLPQDPLIIPITPDAQNKGWAMSPDQSCQPNQYCPYACQSGYYSAQWDPTSPCTDGPACKSMNGGLICNNDGTLTKPFPDKPLCLPGLNNVFINSNLDQSVSFCQTIYPGNEAMLIPTIAKPKCNGTIINSPPSTYWHGTSAQYYVNPKGSSQQQCIWGDPSKAVGNWAPYVLGIGQGYQGNTFMSLSWNPNFNTQLKSMSLQSLYRIEIQCLDCDSKLNKRCYLDSTGGSDCTITVPQGSKAIIILS